MKRVMTKGPIVYFVPGGRGVGGGVHQLAAWKLYLPKIITYENCTPFAKLGAVCGHAPLAEKF